MYNPTHEELASLRKAHGSIFKLVVGDKACILKTPDRKILSFASVAAAKDPMNFNEVLLKNCFVAGDKEIKDDDAYFLGAASKIAEIIEVKEASLEKL